jgi:hypothetical protein
MVNEVAIRKNASVFTDERKLEERIYRNVAREVIFRKRERESSYLIAI